MTKSRMAKSRPDVEFVDVVALLGEEPVTFQASGQVGIIAASSTNLEQIPAKLHDFADKDLLQHIDLARFLFGKVIPPCREAR